LTFDVNEFGFEPKHLLPAARRSEAIRMTAIVSLLIQVAYLWILWFLPSEIMDGGDRSIIGCDLPDLEGHVAQLTQSISQLSLKPGEEEAKAKHR